MSRFRRRRLKQPVSAGKAHGENRRSAVYDFIYHSAAQRKWLKSKMHGTRRTKVDRMPMTPAERQRKKRKLDSGGFEHVNSATART